MPLTQFPVTLRRPHMSSELMNRSQQGTRASVYSLAPQQSLQSRGPIPYSRATEDCSCRRYMSGLPGCGPVTLSQLTSLISRPAARDLKSKLRSRSIPASQPPSSFSEMARIKGRIQWRHRNTLGIGFECVCSDIHDFLGAEHMGIDHFSYLLRWQHLRRKNGANLWRTAISVEITV